MLACVGLLRFAQRRGGTERLRELAVGTMPLVSTGWPVLRTLLAFGEGEARQCDQLRYWVLWGGLWLFHEAIMLVPFAGRLLARWAPQPLEPATWPVT